MNIEHKTVNPLTTLAKSYLVMYLPVGIAGVFAGTLLPLPVAILLIAFIAIIWQLFMPSVWELFIK